MFDGAKEVRGLNELLKIFELCLGSSFFASKFILFFLSLDKENVLPCYLLLAIREEGEGNYFYELELFTEFFR